MPHLAMIRMGEEGLDGCEKAMFCLPDGCGKLFMCQLGKIQIHGTNRLSVPYFFNFSSKNSMV